MSLTILGSYPVSCPSVKTLRMFHCVQVPITDVYGPTAWDADLQCLVVTTDTARGAEKVNEERKRKVSDCAREFLKY